MPVDKVAILTKKAALEFEKLANPMLLEYDLTEAQYKLIKYLYMHPEETVRQVDLERYYSMTHPTAIGLLDQLEKKGYVRRDVNPADKRSRIISLTGKVYEMKDELFQIGDDLEKQFTERLTEKERKRLVALMQKLLGLDGD